MKNKISIVSLAVGLIAVVLAVVSITMNLVSTPPASPTSSPSTAATELQTAEFTHAELTSNEITLVKSALEGSTVGDIRYYSVPATSPAGGSFNGSLTVLAENTPESGKEIRETSLIFQMGSINDQIQIGGVAVYDTANPALLTGQVIVRPIVGGTGKYAGATGWAETTHNTDGSWKHVFYYTTVQRPGLTLD